MPITISWEEHMEKMKQCASTGMNVGIVIGMAIAVIIMFLAKVL